MLRRIQFQAAAAAIGVAAVWMVVVAPESGLRAAEPTGAAPVLERPEWKVGDTWVVETATQPVQAREVVSADKATRVRWRFRVAGTESVAARACYRIQIECLAKGALRPETTVWYDKETLFLQQFETQMPSQGAPRLVRESYSVPKGQYAPVLTPLNVLPISLPVFLPEGAKATGDFTYVSQPTPAGAKDVSVIRFSHQVRQTATAPSSKSLDLYRTASAKAVDGGTLTEIRIQSPDGNLTQLWKKDSPWAVYCDNGRTQSWLVTETP